MTLTLLLALGLAVPTTAQEIRIGNAPATAAASIIPPKLVSYSRPLYTSDARRRGIEGMVTVQAQFDLDGSFKVLRIVKGLGYGLDESALAALKKWRFTPAYRDGRIVSVVTQIDVNFSLFDDPQSLRELNRRLELGKREWWMESIRGAVERWEM